MRIKLNQNQVGRFNLLGTEESLAFSITIVDEEGEIVKVGDVKCVVRLRDSEDPQSKSDELGELFQRGDLDEIARQCLETVSRADEIEECKAFITVYIDHFEELKEMFETSKREKIQKQIEQLNEELSRVKLPPATYEMAELIKGLADKEKQDAERYREWAKDYKKSSPQFKDWTTKAAACDLKASELDAEYEILYEKCEAM